MISYLIVRFLAIVGAVAITLLVLCFWAIYLTSWGRLERHKQAERLRSYEEDYMGSRE